MKQKFCILFLLIFSFFYVANAQFSQKFEHLTKKNGLTESIVNCVFQDSRGFMWFATQNGLNRFDGYEFKHFLHEVSDKNSISNNYISSISEDKNGNLWLATQNGLNKFDRFSHKFNKYIPSAGDTVITSVISDGEILWVGTKTSLYQFNIKSFNFKKINIDNANSAVNALLSVNKILWVGTENGLFKINNVNAKIEKFSSSQNNNYYLKNSTIHTIYSTFDDLLFIGTNRGIEMYNKNTNSFEDIAHSDFSESEIYSVVQDKKGNLWLGTFGKGLNKYNLTTRGNENFKNVPGNTESLSSDYVLSLNIDKSGLLWIGTWGDENNGGINKLDLTKVTFDFTVLGENKKQPEGSDVYAVYQDKNRNIWYGTDAGISILNHSNKQCVTYKLDGKIKPSVYAINQDKNNDFWFGTSENGLYFLSYDNFVQNKITFEKIDFKTDESISVFCILKGNDGNMWVGTNIGLFVFNNKNKISKIYTTDSEKALSDNEIQCLYQDKLNNMWIGTYNGLNYLDIKNGNINQYFSTKNANSIPANSIFSILETDSCVWIGTEGGGLCKISDNNTKFTVFNIGNGLQDNFIYGILSDNFGNLWMSTNKGISKMINPHSNEFKFVNFNTSNGLNCSSFNIASYYKGTNGVMYFGCNEGVQSFNPADIKGNSEKPAVILTDFLLFFQSLEISEDENSKLKQDIAESKQIRISHKDRRISIKFACLNFVQSEKNEYAYKMEGLDENWIYCRNERTANYTDLSPGTYTFRVKAMNNEGIWNDEGASLEIVVMPPFWQENWFRALAFIVFIAMVIFFFRFRTHKLRYQQKILEEKINERTAEVTAQKHELQKQAELLRQANEELNTTNEELNTTLENLKSTQNKLVEQEKMASLGQLTAGVAHEINNPINFVSANVKPLKRDIEDILKIITTYELIINKENLIDKFTEIIQLKKQLDFEFLLEEINNLLTGIDEGASRTIAIVKGLRNFSRLDEDDMKLANINEGIESTILILRNKLKNKAEVILNLNPIPEILCYPGKVNQVFMNIINNAADALRDNGKIIISTSSDEKNIYISIKDNGVGMSEAVQRRIFEPFFTTKDVGDGTGLGLAISYGIVEKHNGKIEVKSEMGVGTEFIISLPLL